MLLLLITIFELTRSALGQQFNTKLIVQEHKTFPLLTSSVNAGDYSDYSFRFRLSSNLTAPCFVEIVFPQESFVSGIGMKFLPNLEVYNPTLVSQVSAPQISEKTLRIYPKKLLSGEDIEIRVKDIKNPFKIGGIGLFEIYTKCDSQIIHVNRNFANIGITEPKEGLLSGSIEFDSGSSQLAGEESRYLFKIVPSLDVSANSIFKITFPDIYNLTNIDELINDFPSYRPCSVSVEGSSPFTSKSDFVCHLIGDQRTLVITGLGESCLIRNR